MKTKLLIILLAITSAANAQLTLDTNNIVLVSSQVVLGIRVNYYEHTQYTCAQSGKQSFLIIYNDTIQSDNPHTLWIMLHGGGIGYWRNDGIYVSIKDNGPFFINGENQDSLISHSNFQTGMGLFLWAKQHPSGFRFLIPSLCDHDAYSGIGDSDTLNPYSPDENGNPRRVDGLLHVRSALLYTLGRYNTTHIVAHGVSIGGVGVTSLAISLGIEGKCLSGIISEAGANSRIIGQLSTSYTCLPDTVNIHKCMDRVGLYMQPLGALLPFNAINNGIMITPMFDIYSRGDMTYCGETTVGVALDDGNPITGPANPLLHKLVDTAIVNYNPGGNSTFRKVCVNANGPNCDGHVITKYDASSFGGDLDNGGADYNQYIINWLQPILNSPPASCILSVSVNEQIQENKLSISIYPNPFSTQTTLQTDILLRNATLTVYNCLGRAVKEIKSINGQTLTLHRDNLPIGLYFLRLTHDNQVLATKKLIITD